MKYLLNFFSNVGRLIVLLASTPKINWRVLESRTEGSKVDRRAKIWPNYYLYHSQVGCGTYIAPNCSIVNTAIGKFCSIGPDFKSGWGIHPIHGISTSPVFYSTKHQAGFTYSHDDKIEETKRTVIGNDVFIGRNVTVLDGIRIGDGAVIGAGAVVSKDIPAYAVAVGAPIKVVKYRFAPETIALLLESKWWDQDETVLKDVERYFFDIEGFLKK